MPTTPAVDDASTTPGPLDDVVALVAGGAGQVGEGVVTALLAAGARVLVPSRSVTKLRELRERVPDDSRLVTFEGGFDDDAEGERVRRVVERVGHLDAVVAGLGAWWSGPPLLELPSRRIREVVEAGLLAHIRCARALLPLVAESAGTYVLLNGSGAEQAVAGSGPANLSAAAQLMLKDVLVAEHDGPARICTLLLGTPIVTRSRSGSPPSWLTAAEVGRYCAWLLSPAATDLHGATVRLREHAQVEEIAST